MAKLNRCLSMIASPESEGRAQAISKGEASFTLAEVCQCIEVMPEGWLTRERVMGGQESIANV